MKPLILLPLALAYLCHRAAKKTRGKGSWAADRALDAVKWILIGASLVIFLI